MGSQHYLPNRSEAARTNSLLHIHLVEMLLFGKWKRWMHVSILYQGKVDLDIKAPKTDSGELPVTHVGEKWLKSSDTYSSAFAQTYTWTGKEPEIAKL